MFSFTLASWLSASTPLLVTLLCILSVLLIIVVLLQRGRGGGLAGAFGGMGGQSAFGTRAGDVFTRITVVMAAIWIILAGVSGMAMRGTKDNTDGLNLKSKAEMKAAADEKAKETADGAATPFVPGAKSDDDKTDDADKETTDKKDDEKVTSEDKKSDSDTKEVEKKTDASKESDAKSDDKKSEDDSAKKDDAEKESSEKKE